jgi:hypothetical protein
LESLFFPNIHGPSCVMLIDQVAVALASSVPPTASISEESPFCDCYLFIAKGSTIEIEALWVGQF